MVRASDLLILVIILAAGIWLLARLGQGKVIEARSMQVSRRQEEAGAYLQSIGYQVCAWGQDLPAGLEVDGEAQPLVIHADLMVEKDGRRYVVEITGDKSTSKPRAWDLDWQGRLLAYYLFFRPDGVIVLDWQRKKLKEVKLDVAPGAVSKRPGLNWGYLLAAGLGALGWWLVLVLTKGLAQ